MCGKCKEGLCGRSDSKTLPVMYEYIMEYSIKIDLTELGWVSVQ
jgi:hypothetical protein